MQKITVLHIASFNGNIGDNANHTGLRRKLSNIIKQEITYAEIEIRHFYKSWNLRDFNSDDFISLCNKYQLVIIGGGNFFELKWDYSHTGTTVNLSEETLKKIKTPILFFGLGSDIGKGYSESTREKFNKFLQVVTNSDKYLVTVRNDGSFETLSNLYGKEYIDKIYKVADGAFFFKTEPVALPINTRGKRFIGINVVCDMKPIRFSEKFTYDDFINAFSRFVNRFLQSQNKFDLIFFPHIYSDIEAISDVLNNINDQYRRYRVTVAPYINGEGSDRYIFGLYQKCELILGMRFHSNVCAIAQNIPTIGLSSYKKIHDLYSELGLLDKVVYVNEEGFENKLFNKIRDTLDNIEIIKKQYKQINQRLNDVENIFYQNLIEWLKRNKTIKGV
ncbi:MAG TPA: polysaccharide pyruvyl transferase family protein [Cerasibacillus sp.]|uniref:polysaccharide pyruvyl transferase family protein n=1 Tax=Cerasibacillus sp. TaxID=2498711 RepID=UPI002F3F53F3